MNVTSPTDPETGIYLYQPNKILPIVFAALVGVSLLIHLYQNFRYKYWKITFFMFYGGVVFTSGWIMRSFSAYNVQNANFYIAQTVLIYAGPPIYSAAEYNVLGRLMFYVPQHAPMHPKRLLYFFIYIGVLVESLTAAGASTLANAKDDDKKLKSGATLISASLLIQAFIELLFIYMVSLMHRRCSRGGVLTPNIRMLCFMLYGTSTLVLFRCICRAIESFSTTGISSCNETCRTLLFHDWYLYAFEAAPMVIYTYWLNIVHPGRLLPAQRTRYLDSDARTERIGPGWIDNRSAIYTFIDPFDTIATLEGRPNHVKYWLNPDDWPEAEGSFALKTASNVGSKKAQSPPLPKASA